MRTRNRSLVASSCCLVWLLPKVLGRRRIRSREGPSTWQRWEHALTSTRHYDNPYADVTLRVRYTGPGGRTLRTYGFWDGGDTFRIRCAFPAPGTWQWETECSDAANAGLHRQRGTVDVSPIAATIRSTGAAS